MSIASIAELIEQNQQAQDKLSRVQAISGQQSRQIEALGRSIEMDQSGLEDLASAEALGETEEGAVKARLQKVKLAQQDIEVARLKLQSLGKPAKQAENQITRTRKQVKTAYDAWRSEIEKLGTCSDREAFLTAGEFIGPWFEQTAREMLAKIDG